MKRFIVRKLVEAESAAEALRKEKFVKPDEVFLDEKWEANFKPLGFNEKK